MLAGWRDAVQFNDLIGKTITSITGATKYNDVITFTTDAGDIYDMYHSQDCCESVTIDDIIGDIEDLIGSPIIEATVDTNSGEGEDAGDAEPSDRDHDGSYTWTFYRISTRQGSVTIRWYGTSNGYYSESVDFYKRRQGHAQTVHG